MDLGLKDPAPFWAHVARKAGLTGAAHGAAAAVFPAVLRSVRSCPICFVLLELEAYVMASLPLDIARDGDVHRRLAAEAPLCNHHAWQLCRLGSPDGVAAFAAARLERLLPAKEYRPGLRSAGGLDPRERGPKWPDECPICALLRIETRELCDILAAIVEPPAPADSLPALRLCLPHSRAALEMASGAVVRQRLVRAEARGMAAVLEELAEARRQYAARARHLGLLRDVHARGVQMCVGMPGLEPGATAEPGERPPGPSGL